MCVCVDCVMAQQKDVAECKAQETQQRIECCMEWASIYALHSKGGANGDERTKKNERMKQKNYDTNMRLCPNVIPSVECLPTISMV